MSIIDETIAERSAAARERAKSAEEGSTYPKAAQRGAAYFGALGASALLGAAQIWENEFARTVLLQLAVYGFMYALAIFAFAIVTVIIRLVVDGETATRRQDAGWVYLFHLLLLLAAIVHLSATAWPLVRCAFDAAQCGLR